ncbi:MAG: nickel insertion protein, partial [bacterium]
MKPQPSKAQPLLALGAVATLTALSLAGALSTAWQAAEQPPRQSPPQVVQLQPSLIERLRKLLGITPRVAVGGSRSGAEGQLCLVSPPLSQTNNDSPATTTALPKPTLLAAEPLNELRIERDGQILWRQRATSTTALEGPIPWPLDPLRPGERVTPTGAGLVAHLCAGQSMRRPPGIIQRVGIGFGTRTFVGLSN